MSTTTVTDNQQFRLGHFVGDVNTFRAETWAVLPAHFVSENPAMIIDAAFIKSAIDCGLLVEPFVRFFPDVPQAWLTRVVVNNDLRGYLDPAEVPGALEQGKILVCEQVELWHEETAKVVSAIQEDLVFPVSASVVVLSQAAGNISLRTVLGANENEHLFVMPGESRLLLDVGQAHSKTGFPGGFTSEVGRGDTCYVPPACAVDIVNTEAVQEAVLVLRITEPSAEELAELLLACFLSGPAEEIAGQHHAMTMPEKIAWLRERLPRFLDSISAREILHLASGEVNR